MEPTVSYKAPARSHGIPRQGIVEQFDRATLSAAIGGTYFTPTAFGILRKEPRSPATSAQANLGFAADDLDNQRHTGSAMRRGPISSEEEA